MTGAKHHRPHHRTSRVLWGSDFPWQSQTEALEAVRHLGLPCGGLYTVLRDGFLRVVQPDLSAG